MDFSWIPEVLNVVVDKAGHIGAVLVILFLVFFVAARQGLFPKFTRAASLVVFVLILLVILIALLLPTIERWAFGTQTVDVILRDDLGQVVPIEFTLRIRLRDHGVGSEEGHGGVAEVRGVPVGSKALELIDIEAPGWNPRKIGPIPIVDGETIIVVVRNEPVAPPDDARRPDPSVFSPTAAQLAEAPEVEPKKVTLHDRNFSGKQLVLVLYPYSKIENPDPWKIKPKWLDFPMEEQAKFYDQFKSGNGLFGVWVRDTKGDYWPLGMKNLFVAPQLSLTVEKESTGSDNPFKLVVEAVRPETQELSEVQEITSGDQ